MDALDGVSRYAVSDTPPAHYMVKIQSFSLLTQNSIDRYETEEFEAGGYKWKMIVYPSGNKSKNVKDHISLYIALQGTSSFPFRWELSVRIRYFLLDQKKDQYMVVEDGLGMERRFNRRKVEWGHDEFISIKTFNNPSNGYLVDDACEFGAELFVCRERMKEKGESLRMIKDPIPYKHTWQIQNYTYLDAECHDSPPFSAGNYKWKIQLYPKGDDTGLPQYLSLYLALVDPTILSPGSKLYTQITLRVLEPKQGWHMFGKAYQWYSTRSHRHGWSKFMMLSTFLNQYYGYLTKDCCSVEAEVTVLGVVRALT